MSSSIFLLAYRLSIVKGVITLMFLSFFNEPLSKKKQCHYLFGSILNESNKRILQKNPYR